MAVNKTSPRTFLSKCYLAASLDLPIDVFMRPSLLWFSAFSAVLAGMGRTIFNERESTPKIVNCSDSNLMFFLSLANAHPFAVQDESTKKTQDLNPERKEGSIPIMLLWGITGAASIYDF